MTCLESTTGESEVAPEETNMVEQRVLLTLHTPVPLSRG